MTVSQNPVTDDLFGPLTVQLDLGRGEVAVEGAALPRIVLSRAAGTRANGDIPVGTRDAGLLVLTIGGEAAALAPGKGRLIRRSYRVDVRHAGRHWRLVPRSKRKSRFLRDGRRLGALVSKGDGRVTADWRPDASPDAMDAAVGYALAAAFGTGADSLWSEAADMIADLIP